jgi:hypothetical protein
LPFRTASAFCQKATLNLISGIAKKSAAPGGRKAFPGRLVRPLSGRRAEPIQARRERLLQSRRDGLNAALLAALQQQARHLLNEQRDAACPFGNPLNDLSGERMAR